MWLMKKSLAEAIEHARAQALEPPAVVMAAFERERALASSGGDPRIFKRAGDVAEIVIQGALTPKPDWYAYWFCGGNTTYPEIIQSLALAAADQGIKRVVLNISSPGGYVDGLFDCLGAIESFSKPKETRASMADSAAYAIASLGGKITATNKAAEFGSVGVCVTYVRYDGVQIYDIVSSNAPNKRPDPSTKEGQAVIREGLDAIEELFVDAIARGRGTERQGREEEFRARRRAARQCGSRGPHDRRDFWRRAPCRSKADDGDEDEEDAPDVEPAGDDEEEAKRSGAARDERVQQAAAKAVPPRQPQAAPAAVQPQPAPPAPSKPATAAHRRCCNDETKHDQRRTQSAAPRGVFGGVQRRQG
jgi:ClpP class serine protease